MGRAQVFEECCAQAQNGPMSATLPGEEPWSRTKYPKRPRHFSALVSITTSTQKAISSCEHSVHASMLSVELSARYLIPGDNGSMKPGERLLNYVWYCNYAANSPELSDLMTDTEGHRHRITMPIGKMRPDVFTRQKLHGERVLPAPYAEVVQKTAQPFVQCITDVSARKAVFFEVSLLPLHLHFD